jgi:NADH-quinone oxidoreductase subunit M
MSLPWFELALALLLAGVLAVLAVRSSVPAARCALVALCASTLCALTAAVSYYGAPGSPGLIEGLALDDATAPMAPVLGLIHVLAVLGASKSRLTLGFSLRVLLSAAISLALTATGPGWAPIALLAAAALLPVWDMASRGRQTRAYVIYLLPILALIAAGWAGSAAGLAPAVAAGLLVFGLALYGGLFPLHGWQPTLFGNAAFGGAILAVLPLLQIPAALKLVVPTAPGWIMDAAGLACLVTAVYAAGMAAFQPQARRFLAYLCLSQAAMVMFAVLLHTPAGVTAGLCLWISTTLSLSGLAFSLRALEARFGPLSLREHHGFYQQAPSLAVCFLIAGLGSVGFPGVIGFVPTELLVSSSLDLGLWATTALAVATMLNGIAIMRAYFSLFTGRRPVTSIPMNVTRSERAGLTIIVLAMLVGGWFSPAFVASRHAAAEALLAGRGEPVAAAH